MELSLIVWLGLMVLVGFLAARYDRGIAGWVSPSGAVRTMGRSMSRRGVVLTVAAVMVCGCGKTVLPLDIGGSKAGGTVVVGGIVTEYDEMDWSGATELAVERCSLWGYRGAVAFSGVESKCMSVSGFCNQFGCFSGCSEKMVTRTYQCVD